MQNRYRSIIKYTMKCENFKKLNKKLYNHKLGKDYEKYMLERKWMGVGKKIEPRAARIV